MSMNDSQCFCWVLCVVVIYIASFCLAILRTSMNICETIANAARKQREHQLTANDTSMNENGNACFWRVFSVELICIAPSRLAYWRARMNLYGPTAKPYRIYEYRSMVSIVACLYYVLLTPTALYVGLVKRSSIDEISVCCFIFLLVYARQCWLVVIIIYNAFGECS